VWVGLIVTITLNGLILSSVKCDDNAIIQELVSVFSGGQNTYLEMIFDLSHEPKPSELCTNNPESGDPCNGLARNDDCYTDWGVNLLKSNHCNKCCKHLILPGSCTVDLCKCYSNSGCIA
jgi:hypothetical protein